MRGITGDLPGLQALAGLTKLRLVSDDARELPVGLWALTRLSELVLLYQRLQARDPPA